MLAAVGPNDTEQRTIAVPCQARTELPMLSQTAGKPSTVTLLGKREYIRLLRVPAAEAGPGDAPGRCRSGLAQACTCDPLSNSHLPTPPSFTFRNWAKASLRLRDLPANCSPALSMEAPEEEDGWEYEYDLNETEDFYITLDLTSQVPPLQRRKPTLQPDDEDRIQILELHSGNPLLFHQDKLYSCEWASAVGTDLLFTLPADNLALGAADISQDTTTDQLPQFDSSPSHEHSYIRTTPDYTILAATPHRIIATPSVRKPKTDGNVLDPTGLSGAALATRPQRLHKHAQRAAQAEFLEKLAELKLRKGQTDEVPMHNIATPGRPRTILRPRLTGTAAGASWGSGSPSQAGEQDDDDDEGDEDADDDADDDDDDPDADDDHDDEENDENNGEDDYLDDFDESEGTNEASRDSSITASPRRDSSRARRGRRGSGKPRGRARIPLARDNLIGGLVGDGVKDRTASKLLAFQETTGFQEPYAGAMTRSDRSRKNDSAGEDAELESPVSRGHADSVMGMEDDGADLESAPTESGQTEVAASIDDDVDMADS
ncbi:hypothetical protein FH972_023063 [Carpinus fangiana]|uniref:Transcription factor TFIIIC triple barrel domain-containing protein n=1 Tax=Carpinus fangiana TaxID=176857 RepID=A0A5N6KUG4_9ROSI|nr:hypothetical protein FH972_023063 [Carpinus fangiana]